MDNVLLKIFEERFGTKAQEKWLHVPNSIVVGRSKNGSKLAAISARWLKDSWPGKSSFEKWCGFAPSNSRQGTKEVLKAASGLVEEVENVPTSGFKLSLSLNCDELLEGRGAARPTRQPLLMPNCALSICGMSYAYIDTYNNPVIAVEDPRGWAIMVSQAQAIKLMAARACSSADRLELPGPLVYVFSRYGFTIDFPDGELAGAAVDDKAADEVKKSAASRKKEAVLEVGQICIDMSKRTEMVYLGMFPQDLTSSQMETVCAFAQPALKAIYDAAVFALVESGSRHELDDADLAEQTEKAVAESLQKELQSVSAKNADEIGELDCALKAWRMLHDTLAPTFSCIGKHRSDGKLFMLSDDFADVEKHSIESLLAAKTYDVDVIKHGIRVADNARLWSRNDRPNSKEISGFLKPPKGVFQVDGKKAKELACCSKGFAEADGNLFISAYDYVQFSAQSKTFEYSYKKVIAALEARRLWLGSLYKTCFELNNKSLWNDSKALAEHLAADNCKKLKLLFPSLVSRRF